MLVCLYTMNISHNPKNALLPFGPNPLLPYTLLMYCITFHNCLFISVLQKALSPLCIHKYKFVYLPCSSFHQSYEKTF